MRQGGTIRMRQLERPGQGKIYRMKGRGFFSKLAGTFGRLGKSLLNTAKPIAKSVLKEVAPLAVTAVANKAGETLAKRGASDSVVNAVGRLGQTGAQALTKSLDGSKLDENQKLVSNFLSNKGQALLGDFLNRQGNGVRGLGVRGLGAGEGVRGLGAGEGVRGLGVRGLGAGGAVRNLGGSLTIQEAPRI